VDGKNHLEHRVVMARAIGRPLQRTEHVHHINGKKLDNRIENLEILTASEHTRKHHPRIYPIEKTCVICGVSWVPDKSNRKRQRSCSYVCGLALRLGTSKATSRAIHDAVIRMMAEEKV
jgi:hypothetical protein